MLSENAALCNEYEGKKPLPRLNHFLGRRLFLAPTPTMKIFFIATLLISVCVLDLTTGAALSEDQNPAVEMSEEQFPQYGFGVNSEEEAVLGASDTLL
eukprot:sb/3478900/